MKRYLKSLVAMILAGSVAAALVGCSSGSSTSEPSTSATLNVRIASDVVSLDPQLQGDMTSMGVARNIFDTLTVRDDSGQLQPGLATSWEATDDLTWRFHLRDEAKFTNDEPVNAEAVAFSINRLLDPATKSPIVELKNIDHATVVDDLTVDFVMKAPDPIIPAKVSLFGGVILPPKYTQSSPTAQAEHPIGSGPYTFESRQESTEIVLVRNDDYWGPKSSVAKIVFKVMPDTSSALASLQAGDIDIVTGATQDALTQVSGSTTVKTASTPGIRTYNVNIDTKSAGPLSDVKVRQAVNYATDVDQIVNSILGGAAKKVPTLMPDAVTGFDGSVAAYDYDPDQARELLTEAGYPDGFSTQLYTSSADTLIAQAISGQLEKVGIHAEVKPVDPTQAKSDIITLNQRQDGAMYLVANSGWTLDGASFIQSNLKSDSRSSRWNNPQIDQLVTREETSLDDEARLQAFSQIQNLLHDEAPFVYLFAIDNVYAMSDSVEWTMPTTGVWDLSTATKSE